VSEPEDFAHTSESLDESLALTLDRRESDIHPIYEVLLPDVDGRIVQRSSLRENVAGQDKPCGIGPSACEPASEMYGGSAAYEVIPVQ